MSKKVIRWEQRLSSYKKAVKKLDEAVSRVKSDFIDEANSDNFIDEIIKEGVIQRFEYTHELAWKLMKDFLKEKGNTKIYGSKDATREAFAAELIIDGHIWMDMIKSRNHTSHTYNEETADNIFNKIMHDYHPEFMLFRDKMVELSTNG